MQRPARSGAGNFANIRGVADHAVMVQRHECFRANRNGEGCSLFGGHIAE
ncbi:MAG: hypothetical protein P0Y66_05875 [Candidatus Kaistia colombiensis]|nr:MAG: hypothetical protein P0Y66_05875 [Kaistia sp.]